jgi:hypothetical protein
MSPPITNGHRSTSDNVRYSPAKDGVIGRRCCGYLKILGAALQAASPCLTQKAPYKGLCADSGEKHEPASDIDTSAVDSQKRLTPTGRLEKRTLNRSASSLWVRR